MAKKNTVPAAELPKPRVRALTPTQFAVEFRGVRGHVYKDDDSRGQWRALRHINDEDGEGLYRVCWRSEDAFAVLIERLGEVADCREVAVLADQAESKGLRKRLAELGGNHALAAFDDALAKVQRDNAEGLTTVRGMIKVAMGRKLPKAESFMTGEGRTMHRVTVVPGFSVSVNALTYYIGGQAEYDSWNLHYFGEITSITANTVTIRKGGRESCRRLPIDCFAGRNARDIASKAAQDADTMNYI